MRVGAFIWTGPRGGGGGEEEEVEEEEEEEEEVGLITRMYIYPRPTKH
jgi:hypothetical protein